MIKPKKKTSQMVAIIVCLLGVLAGTFIPAEFTPMYFIKKFKK
jgi:hypothetical protein